MQRQEGYIQVVEGKVWYEIVGGGKDIPLIVLHGGPAYPHDYLQPLEDISDKRQIIFYDQLGCGNSQKSQNRDLWTVERFVLELRNITSALKLKSYHILGQSWGSTLACEFALTKPKGLKSLILADPYLSSPKWEEDARKLLRKLPKSFQKALENKDFNSKEYKEASKEFYFRYVYRLKILPTPILKAEYKSNSAIYTYMWGSSEFDVTGTLKDYDLASKLHKINLPVLLLCGRYDEATPETAEYFKNLFPNAKIKVFEKSAHMPHWTEKENYLQTVSKFLEEN